MKNILYYAIDEVKNVEIPPSPLCPSCDSDVTTAAQIAESIMRIFMHLSIDINNVSFLIHFGFINELLILSLNKSPLPFLISTQDLLYKIDTLFLRTYDFGCGIRLYHEYDEDTHTILERRKNAKNLSDLGFNVKLCEKALEIKKGNRDEALGIIYIL